MTNTDTAPQSPKSGRAVKIALALSLALNLAVAGVIAGAALRANDDHGAARRGIRDVNFSPFTEALTREQRRDMVGHMSKRGGDLREMRAQMRTDLEAVVAALRADPFDGAAVETAFTNQGARLSARADAGRGALVRLILDMSDAERTEFVRRLDVAMKHRFRTRKKS